MMKALSKLPRSPSAIADGLPSQRRRPAAERLAGRAGGLLHPAATLRGGVRGCAVAFGALRRPQPGRALLRPHGLRHLRAGVAAGLQPPLQRPLLERVAARRPRVALVRPPRFLPLLLLEIGCLVNDLGLNACQTRFGPPPGGLVSGFTNLEVSANLPGRSTQRFLLQPSTKAPSQPRLCRRLDPYSNNCRIRECGEDKRFADIRVNPLRFLSVWSIQGLWVLLTVLPVLLALTHAAHDPQLHPLDVVGVSLWVAGFALEVTADYQKTQFRRDKSKRGQFIQSGLWYYSRHPNYFGEIMIWVGVFLAVTHTMPGLALKCWAAVSPAFVALLLLRVSGIPLLEKQGDERWGDSKAYQEYKARTSLLVLLPKRKAKSA